MLADRGSPPRPHTNGPASPPRRRSTARASPPSRATPRSSLHSNFLTGAIPTELGLLTKLEGLYASRAALAATAPLPARATRRPRLPITALRHASTQ